MELKDKNSKKSIISQGGRIIVHILRATEATANPRFFSFNVKINNKEVFNQKGSPGITYVPNPPSSHGLDGICWIGIKTIDLIDPFQKGDTLQVFVLDGILRSDNFILSHK